MDSEYNRVYQKIMNIEYEYMEYYNLFSLNCFENLEFIKI